MSRFAVPGLLIVAFVAFVASALVGCQTYSDQLHRAEEHYSNARYEAALVNLEDLEIHLGSLSSAERVRYDVVRGMTHLRLAQRPDARHWLALAREDAHAYPQGLSDANRATIDRLLAELDPLNPHPTGESGAPEGDLVGDGGAGPAAAPAPASSGGEMRPTGI